MQDAEKPDLGSQVFRITGNGLERLGDRVKQQTIHLTRIMQREGTEGSWEGKDHVAVWHLQKVTLAGRQPGGLRTPLGIWDSDDSDTNYS